MNNIDPINPDKLAEKFLDPIHAPAGEEKAIIKVIGVGGGGSNAVNHMYRQGIEHVSFVVCNTDLQALRDSPVPTKVVIGDGLGAGNIPEKARKFAEDDYQKLEAMFDDETRMAFITAGMGGGTGTGASPVVARISRERGILTIGIVTIPFLFEGESKILKAIKGAEELAKYVDALLIINNERLVEIYGDLDFINAFGKADDTLSTAARSISEIITCQGHINLDFNDVDTTLRNGGAAIISTGYGEGEHRVSTAIKDALNSPLLKNKDIFGSKKLLFNLYFSRNAQKKFAMNEVDDLRSFVSSIDRGVDVIYGVAFDDSLGDKVKITILAAGFDVTIEKEENGIIDHKPVQGGDKPKPTPTPQSDEEDTRNTLEKLYGQRAAEIQNTYVVLQPNQLDDDAMIDLIEKNSTYNRDKQVINDIKRNQTLNSASSAPRPNAPTQGNNLISFD